MMPGLFKTIDDVATDGVVQIQIDKEAMQKDTNIKITVDILNSETP
jgi:hypothetical protein